MEQTPQNTGAAVSTAQSSSAPLLIGVLVALLLVVGGWYLMGQNGEMAAPSDTLTVAPATTAGTVDAAAAALSTQGTSDEIADIDTDLKATNLESIGDATQI